MKLTPKPSIPKLALLVTCLASLGCAADRANQEQLATLPPGEIMAFQSVRKDVLWGLGTPPTEIVLVPHQEFIRPAIAKPTADTINGTWFEGAGFEPGSHVGQLENGTGVVELSWRDAWFQSYHLVFILSDADTGHRVTHIGVLSNGDAGNEWMRVESAQIRLFTTDRQLQLRFQLSGDWNNGRKVIWFTGSLTSDPSTWVDIGVSDLSWGSVAALDELLGKGSPFATNWGE
jgi:hypothetical protein